MDFVTAARRQIGRPVTSLIPEIVNCLPAISAITLVLYRPAPLLSERLRDRLNPAPGVYQDSDRLHQQYGLDFWQTVLSISNHQAVLDTDAIDLALIHDADPDEHEIQMARRDINGAALDHVIASAPAGFGVSISSKVSLVDGGSAHLPMLDFRCPHSPSMAKTITYALRLMGQRSGALIRSPRSYHYYGCELMTDTGLREFLGKALLITPLTDGRYIAHRLIDGVCRLRIGAVSRKGAAPVVEEVLD